VTTAREMTAPEPAPPLPTALPVPAVPAEVNVEIGSTPEGAEVWLPGDKEARGRTPVNLKLPRGAGEQAVTLKAAGYVDAALRVDRSADGAAAVALTKVPPPPAPRTTGKRADTKKGNKRGSSVVNLPTNPAPTQADPYRAVGD
jgi:hypothetical protein